MLLFEMEAASGSGFCTEITRLGGVVDKARWEVWSSLKNSKEASLTRAEGVGSRWQNEPERMARTNQTGSRGSWCAQLHPGSGALGASLHGFPRQDAGEGCRFLHQGDLSDPGFKLRLFRVLRWRHVRGSSVHGMNAC